MTQIVAKNLRGVPTSRAVWPLARSWWWR